MQATFKEMIIRQVPNGILPQLALNGQWLEDLGFTSGIPVHAVYKNSCLTLTTFDVETINYTPNVLCVTTRLVRKRPRTQLVLNGFLLMKCGFKVGDRLGLTLNQGMIQLSKINRYTTDKVA